MSILPLDVDYTSRDFDALKDRLELGIQSVFPKWTDFEASSFANILLECICFVGDVLAVYEDSIAREAFLSTCVSRINAIRHCRTLGYTLRGASAAQVDLKFTLRQTYTGDIVFQKGKIVRSQSATNPARVQLLSDLTILAGNLTGTVTAENSISHQEVFDSDDQAEQEFELTQTPFLGVTSFVDDVGAYAKVETFLESTSTDRHYLQLVSEDVRGLLKTGDAQNGKIPSGEVIVDYKTGGGSIVIEKETLVQPEFSVASSLGEAVLFDVTNPAAASGGLPQETVEEARINAPASVRVNERSVSKEDFEINGLRVTGMARALMLTSDQEASLAENYGQLNMVAVGSTTASGLYLPATPTAAKLGEVAALIANSYPPCVTFRLDVIAAAFKVVDITARLWLTEGAVPATVDAAIRSTLADYFAVLNADLTPTTTMDFGYNYTDEVGASDPYLPWGDIFTAIKTTAGVRKVDEDAQLPADDVLLLSREWPTLGTVTLINARTGLALV
jgi:hypothetical protein